MVYVATWLHRPGGASELHLKSLEGEEKYHTGSVGFQQRLLQTNLRFLALWLQWSFSWGVTHYLLKNDCCIANGFGFTDENSNLKDA